MSAYKCFKVASLCLMALVQSLFSQITLTGVVMDSGSEPVQNALVVLTDQADPNRLFSDLTDEQGRYAIQIIETGVKSSESRNPGGFKLSQNYPNPFNPSTVISYEWSRPAVIRIEISDIFGRKIKTVFDGFQPAGAGQLVWNATDDQGQGVPAGVYICSLNAEGQKISRKMILLDGRHDSNSNPSRSGRWDGPRPDALLKPESNEYILKITGIDIEPYEQKKLMITGNTILDITVIRTVTDIDGNVYRTVKIGDQWWMSENLKVTRYRNGDAIPIVTDGTKWPNLTTGARCDYDNDATNTALYGSLYNWYVVGDGRYIAPAGWHVPSDAELKKMEMHLGMNQAGADSLRYRGTVEGGKLKEADTTHWSAPNTGATNETGFSALPAGCRMSNGVYHDMRFYTYYWASSDDGSGLAWYRLLSYKYSKVYRYSYNKTIGFSIRCVKD